MTSAERQSAASSSDLEEGEDTGSSNQHQDPAAEDENTWRADVVEGASEYLGRRPTMRLDRAVRRNCSR